MKIYNPGDSGKALCEADGLVTTTFRIRDVPLSDGSAVVKQILVGVCDQCGKVLSIPPQSVSAIWMVRQRDRVTGERNDAPL